MITSEMVELANLLVSLRRQKREIEREEKAIESALGKMLEGVNESIRIGGVQYVVKKQFNKDICAELMRRGLWHCMSMQPKPAEIFKAVDMGKIDDDTVNRFVYEKRYFVVRGNDYENSEGGDNG